MNIPLWSLPSSPFNPSTTIPSNYYAYSFMQSPYNSRVVLNSSVQTSLNSSSGYESASSEVSFFDPSFASPSSTTKEASFNFHYQPFNDVDNKKRKFDESEENFDEEIDDGVIPDFNEQHSHVPKKRRVLSRMQREEANRRERQRMEIINDAYEQLRRVLPFKKGRKRQKMSRMDTVDGAIRYIHTLLEALHGQNYDPNWAK